MILTKAAGVKMSSTVDALTHLHVRAYACMPKPFTLLACTAAQQFTFLKPTISSCTCATVHKKLEVAGVRSLDFMLSLP